MSKKLIAGLGTVAALGIAALPLTGVFAADTDTADTVVRVRVTTSVECTSAGTTTDFVWLGSVAPGVTTSGGDFTVSGSTNAAAGFTLTGVPTALVSGTLDASLNEATQRGELTDFTANSVDSIAYTATANTDDSWWVTTQSGTTANITGSSIVLSGTAGSVQEFGLTATAKPGLGTQPGLYQGVIEWTCSVTQP